MEDRRTALAILLCILVVITYTEVVVSPYSRQGLGEPKNSQSEASAPASSSPASPVPTLAAATQANVAAPQAIPAAAAQVTQRQILTSQSVTIETDEVIARINSLGGRISSLQLKKYRRVFGSPELLDLVNVAAEDLPPPALVFGSFTDGPVQYQILDGTGGERIEGKTISVSSDDELVVLLRGTLADGRTVEKRFAFTGNSYLIEAQGRTSVPNSDGRRIWFDWNELVSNIDNQGESDQKHYTILTEDDSIERIMAKKVLPTPSPIKGKWVAFADRYFATSFVPQSTNDIQLRRAQDVFHTEVAGDAQSVGLAMYLGPKDKEDLARAGFALERSIDLGFFTFLAVPLLVLLNIFNGWFGNYGLAIILLTLVIKTAFLPLTKKSLLSMKAMQDLQPEMQALRQRIKDPAELNREVMALYKRKGVNPLGGCLPVLIQLPVFLGLYQALLNSIDLRHSPFALWINDLSAPENLVIAGIGVPVMIILMGISMFYQMYTQPSTMDPAQQKVMLFTPVIFTVMFIIFPFPSGLVLYWLVNNLISIVQQTYLRNEKRATPFQATAVASVVIFAVGYVVTLL